MVIEETAKSDSQFILREILQNKAETLQKDADITKPTMQDTQKPHITSSDNPLPSNELNGDHVIRSDRDSETGSDEESSFLDQSRVDETEVDDGKSDVDENQCNSENVSGEESKEAKRARVENLLTSMQHPSQYMNVDMDMFGYSEVRRQKRKQSLPQQHEQPPKYRRLDCPHVDEELAGLRQLSAMQNYFRQYEEAMPKPMNMFDGMDNMQRLHQAYFVNLSARHAEELQKEQALQARPTLGAFEKKVASEKDHFNIAEHVRETMSANKGLSKGMAELNDKELNELIGSLKSKIEEAVSVTVDKELSKFFSKRNKQKDGGKEQTTAKEDHARNGEIKHESGKKPTDHSLNSILQLPDKTNVNNNNNSINNNSAFRLQGHSAFELPKLNNSIQELPRAPFPHHPPLGYPPFSLYLPTSLHQPYPCPIVPPEQNEPLSLVVNTPKKKRTKVTDTRLSPRAARALLHENGSLGSLFDHERALSSGLGPLNSACLPTSVAIPNPSLQNSDIMSFYKEQAMCNSPSENDRNTPRSNSPSDGGYGFMKSDFYPDGDGFDPHGKQTISFFRCCSLFSFNRGYSSRKRMHCTGKIINLSGDLWKD